MTALVSDSSGCRGSDGGSRASFAEDVSDNEDCDHVDEDEGEDENEHGCKKAKMRKKDEDEELLSSACYCLATFCSNDVAAVIQFQARLKCLAERLYSFKAVSQLLKIRLAAVVVDAAAHWYCYFTSETIERRYQ